MPAQCTPERAAAIFDIIARYPNGVTVAGIAAELPDAPEIRIVYSWVVQLAYSGRFTVEGNAGQALVRLVGERPTASEAGAATAAAPSSATPAAAPIATGTPVVDPPPAPPTDDFDELVKVAVQSIVGYGIVPSGARPILQELARKNGRTGAAVGAFADHVLSLLATLTAADAESKYDVTPDDYERWVEHRRFAEGELETRNSDGENQSASASVSAAESAPAVNKLPPQSSNQQQKVAKDTKHGRQAEAPNGQQAKIGNETGATPDANPLVNRDPKVEHPSTPQSAVRNPQFPSSLTPSLPHSLSTLLSREHRAWIMPAAGTLVTVVIGTLLSAFSATVSQHPWATLGGLAMLGFGGWMWVKHGRDLGARRPRRAGWAGGPASSDEIGPVGPARDEGVASPENAAPAPGGNHRRPSRWPWHVGGAVAAIAILVTGVVGGMTSWRAHQGPPDDAVASYVVTSVAPLPIRIANLKVTPAGSDTLAYQAVLETTAPLYKRIDVVEYLRSHDAAALATIEAADALLRGPDGARLRVAVAAKAETGNLKPEASSNQVSGLKSQVSGLPSLLLVTTQTPVGTTAAATGLLIAWRRDGRWAFTPQQGGFDRSRLAGEPKPAGALAVDDPADAAKLQAIVAEHVASANQVQAAAAAALAAERERQKQAEAAAAAKAERERQDREAAAVAERERQAREAAAKAELEKQKAAEAAARKDQGPGANGEGAATKDQGPGTLQLPSFPAATGAYVLIDGAWAGLPTNHGKTYQTIAEKLLSKVLEAELWEHRLAGKPKALSQKVVGSIRFDGRELAKAAPGKGLIIAYVGPLETATAEQVAKYPPLKDYPALELIRLEADRKGVRTAPLQLVGPGRLGFGSNRVDAVVERPQPGVTVLRTRAELGAGRYALAGGAALYELEAK